ncbi:hypothetical protein [Lacrimispora sp.]|uniref:hypothetical protein n=1 Tax=Lacrimispora sp. TaxID=2719234 RepID=UPI00285EEC5C|nr:hypothetical protein [Lacrimispora sp.]MDR7812060.1 hypothetical protein [Lacrimispora sp.]
MAEKKVYFFKVNLRTKDGEDIDYKDLKDIFIDIIDKNAIEQDNFKSIDLTIDDEYTHIIWDIFDYENSRLFGRFSKQKPSNTMIKRYYKTMEKENIGDGDERTAGIEQYTYGNLDYDTGIFSIVGALGAPNEKAIAKALWKYNRDYQIELVPIPNAQAIQDIYEGEGAEITRVEIEVPLPEAGVLQQIFNWDDDQVINVMGDRNLSAGVVLKPLARKGRITRDTEETKGLLDCISRNKAGYNKARIKAKTINKKLREYDLFDQYFSYPIDIAPYHMQGSKRIYFTVDELVDIYRQNIVYSFETNRRLLKLIVSR